MALPASHVTEPTPPPTVNCAPASLIDLPFLEQLTSFCPLPFCVLFSLLATCAHFTKEAVLDITHSSRSTSFHQTVSDLHSIGVVFA